MNEVFSPEDGVIDAESALKAIIAKFPPGTRITDFATATMLGARQPPLVITGAEIVKRELGPRPEKPEKPQSLQDITDAIDRQRYWDEAKADGEMGERVFINFQEPEDPEDPDTIVEREVWPGKPTD